MRAALDLLDEAGLDGLTLRRLADRLDVRAPALYWHVRNKAELLEAVAARVFADALADLEAPRRGEPWPDWLADTAHRLRRAALSHRDGARVLAGAYLAHALGRPTELALRVLCDAGFSPREAARGLTAVYAYVQGFTLEEQATAAIRQVDAERYPLTAAARADLSDHDTHFDHGLRLLLSGLRLSRLGRTGPG